MFNIAKWPPLPKVCFRYGLVAGLLGFILVIGLYYINNHPFLIPVFLDYRIALFTIIFVFALKELRDFYYDGILHFWQGMISTLLITIIFSLIVSVFIYIFASIKSEFVQSYIDLSLVQVQAFSNEDIDRLGRGVYEEGIRSLKTADAYFLASRYFWQSFIISFFLSIIISVILRRQPKL